MRVLFCFLILLLLFSCAVFTLFFELSMHKILCSSTGHKISKCTLFCTEDKDAKFEYSDAIFTTIQIFMSLLL